MIRRVATAAAVLVALTVLYVAAGQTLPGTSSKAAAAGPASMAGATAVVTSVSRTCPPPGPGTGEAHIALVAVPGQGAASGGTAQLSTIPFASSATPPGKTTAGADMWFVGAGTTAGAPVTRLYLMNPGTVAASVVVTIITDSGIQQGLNAAITVAPGQYLWENIAQYTAGSVVLALHVQASTGQVASAVWQGQSGSSGTWLPQAAAPATQVVIPGLTTASSAARLFVVVPGTGDAKVKVTALTAHGPFQPFGSAPEDAPAGAASSFSLTSLGASAAGLVLTSNVPVTAGIAVAGSGAGSFSAAATPLTGQGVVAGNPVGGQSSVGLVLSAPDGMAIATITVVPQAGGQAPTPQPIQIPSGTTVAVTVRPPSGKQPYAVVVTPGAGSGPLYAARVVTSGGGLSGPVTSILPVPSAPTQIALPPTRDSYSAIMP